MTQRYKIRYESASATIEYLGPKLATIMDVWATNRKQGHGSGLMEKIVQYADERDLVLWLVAQAYGPPREILDNRKLEAFYTRYGFERQPEFKKPARMIRYPSDRN